MSGTGVAAGVALPGGYAQPASLMSRLARGTAWSLTGVAVSRSLTLLASVLVARVLGRDGFGALGVVQSTVAMLQVFAGFGLGMTATKYVAQYCRKDAARAGQVIALSQMVALLTGSIGTTALYFGADWLAVRTLAAPQLAPVLRIGSPMLLLGALHGSQTGALAGFEAFGRIALVSAISGMASFPLLLAGAYWAGLEGAVAALGAGMLLNCAGNEWALRSEAARFGVPLRYRPGGLDWRVLWSFSTPAVLAGSLVAPVQWIAAALLVNRPHGYGEMGVLNAANQWYAAIILLPALVGNVTLPLLAQQLGDGDRGRARQVMAAALRANALIVLPLVLLVCAGSRYIMGAYGGGFAAQGPTLVVAVATAAVLAVQLPVGQVIAAAGRMWLGCAMNFGWAVVTIVLTLLLLERGAVGVAAARLGGYLVHGAWTFAFAYWFFTRGAARTAPGEA